MSTPQEATEASFKVMPSVEPTIVTVKFDAAGPFIGYESTCGTKRNGGILPIKAAAIQKNIYMRGSRYWRKWARAECPTESESIAKLSKKQMLQVGVLVLVAIGITYAVTKTQKTQTQS